MMERAEMKEMDERSGKIYTIRDIEALPEGKRVELIDGRMYEMASPARVHQRLLGELYRLIANYIEEWDGACEVYPAPFAVYINNDDYNYVEPDVLVICDEEKTYTFQETVPAGIYEDFAIDFSKFLKFFQTP